MLPVEIRRVEGVRDFQCLHGLLVKYEQSLPPDLRHGLSDPEHVLGDYAEPNAAFLAFAEGHAIGCVAVTKLDDWSALIMRLFVDPLHRKLGAARRLVAVALHFARERQFRRVVLDTDKERLAAAYALYQSFGFQECAAYGPVDYTSPTYMELRL